MSAKDKYRSFCLRHPEIPLFLQFNWLNTLFEESEWIVLLDERESEIFAAMPLVMRKARGLSHWVTPLLNPYQGVYLNYPPAIKQAARTAFEMECLENLIEQIPYTDSFNVKFAPDFVNHLPFYWNGYHQTTQFTYIISSDSDINEIREQYRGNVRREIRKAQENLQLVESADVAALYQLKKQADVGGKKGYLVEEAYLQRIFKAASSLQSARILEVRDEQQNLAAAALFVADAHYVYYLYGGTHPDFNKRGAMSFLLDAGIQWSREKGVAFNFEGSMLPGVERFFRSFGGKLTPYSRITKSNSIPARIIAGFRK